MWCMVWPSDPAVIARETISGDKADTELSLTEEPPFHNPGGRVTGVGELFSKSCCHFSVGKGDGYDIYIISIHR